MHEHVAPHTEVILAGPEVRQIPVAEDNSVATTTTDVDWKLCLVFPHGDSGGQRGLNQPIQRVAKVAPKLVGIFEIGWRT